MKIATSFLWLLISFFSVTIWVRSKMLNNTLNVIDDTLIEDKVMNYNLAAALGDLYMTNDEIRTLSIIISIAGLVMFITNLVVFFRRRLSRVSSETR